MEPEFEVAGLDGILCDFPEAVVSVDELDSVV